jgi:hypothetical protein
MAEVLVELYVRQRSLRGAPERVLLDFDSTDDPAHGKQEGVAYHGYFGQHQYHPLLVFDMARQDKSSPRSYVRATLTPDMAPSQS